MRFTTNKAEFVKNLTYLKKILFRKHVLPHEGSILIDCINNSLYCISNDIAIKIKNAFTIEEQGITSVQGKNLLELAKYLEEEIICEVEDNKFRIISGTVLAELNCEDTYTYPEWPVITPEVTISINAEIFKKAIQKTLYASDDFVGTLNGLLLSFKDNFITTVATDGKRLAHYQVEVDEYSFEELKIFIPKQSISEFINLIDNDTITINASKNAVIFQTDKIDFFTKLIDAQFPKYETVIPQKYISKVLCKKEHILNSLRRTSLISKKHLNATKLEINNNLITFTANNQEIGFIKDSISAITEKEPIEITFNAMYLIDAIEVIDEEDIVIEFSNKEGPAKITALNAQDYFALVMPMRG